MVACFQMYPLIIVRVQILFLVTFATRSSLISQHERPFYELQTWASLHHVKNVLPCVYRSYNLSFRMQSKARKTIVTQCLLNRRKYAFRLNSHFGVTASVFVHGGTCITIAISVNIMNIAIFNVGKQIKAF